MAIDIGKAVYSLIVDDSGVDAGLKRADEKVTQATKQINTKMVAMAAALGGIIGSVMGPYITQLLGELNKIQSFFTGSWKVTAEYGEQMEHLGARMGMTASQAAVLTGVMERHGIEAGIAARSMTMLAVQLRQAEQSANPLNTKLGQMLGSLRNVDGSMMNTSQVMEAARQKILSTSDATQRLEIAQSVFGARMGGQLLPVLSLSNEAWKQQNQSVKDSLGNVDAAATAAMKYKEASAALQQSLRGVQLELGTAMLPILTEVTDATTRATASWKKFFEEFDTHKTGWQNLKNLAGGSEDDQFKQDLAMEMQKLDAKDLETAQKKKQENEDYNSGLMESAKLKAQEVQTASRALDIAEKEAAIGGGSDAQVQIALQEKLLKLTEQRAFLENQMKLPNLKQDTIDSLQEQLDQNRLAGAQAQETATQKHYQLEEDQAKALGQFNITQEIAFMQEQLNDSHIVGDERLKIEAQLFAKKKAFEEDMMKISRELGAASVQDEIRFRQAKTKELLGSGDITGAAGEMKKITDLRLQEGDSLLQWEKKYQIISIQYEIDFQQQKLEVVKGNAAEERKVLESIADLDKQLYDKRLSYAESFSSSMKGQLDTARKAAQSGGESMSFGQAKVQGGRDLLEAARTNLQNVQGGGTTEQRETALKFVDFMDKQEIQLKQTGQQMDEFQLQAHDISQKIKGIAGLDTRDVTGPSAAVSSVTAPSEGLATTSLARGTEIPRLDTSYTDLAVRIRDVFLNAIPNIENFSNALSSAAKKITGGSIGNPINIPGGGLGPGGGPTVGAPGASQQALPNGQGTPAQPQGQGGTVTIGGVTVPLGQGGNPSAAETAITSLNENVKAQGDVLKNLTDTLTDFKLVLQKGIPPVETKVSVGVDPNSKDGLTAVMDDHLSKTLA